MIKNAPSFEIFSSRGFFLSLGFDSLLKNTLPPTNIEEAFSRFLSALELTDPQSSLVADRQNALRDRLMERAPFKIEKTLLYGSYERSSQIRPRSQDPWTLDVDVLVIMANHHDDIKKYHTWGDGGHRLLNDLKNSVDGFQGLTIEMDAPAICAKWVTQKMKVELTPAFRLERGFCIPSSSYLVTTWQITDPIGDSSALSQSNKKTNGQLKPFIKAMKCWNRRVGRLLSSYAIETAAYHSIANRYAGLEIELKRFFNNLLVWNGKSLQPPSGIGGDVHIKLSNNIHKVQAALERIERAYRLQAQRNGRAAVEEMAKVFGKPFPLAPEPGLLDWYL